MTITSLGFLVFMFFGGLCYYVLPKSWQWIELLILSVIFYCMAARPYTLLFVSISTLTAWVATNYVFANKNGVWGSPRRSKIIIAVVVLINLGLWVVLKGSGFWLSISNRFGFKQGNSVLTLEAALGMSYYTLQVIGYVLDVYWESVKPQKNIAKLFLFVLFFPQMITGPISRYSELGNLYQQHPFCYENVTRGAQRILWGFFKKLVLAERTAVIVNSIWGNLDAYQGYYRWIAFLLYPVQLYADFSGCMDIVLGTAEVFDIKLHENFDNPFFAKTVQEFWQRWHITLGTWAKDYVMFPLLKSKVMIELGKKVKRRFGKKCGKHISIAIGTFVLWMFIGIWHGGFRYIVGVGLWYWGIMMLGEFCSPLLNKCAKYLRICQNNFSWRLFQSVRTYLLFAVGAVFFRASYLKEGIEYIRSLFSVFKDQNRNMWVFFDGSLGELAGGYVEINIIIFAIVLLFLAALLRSKYGFARVWIAKQGVIFRWLIWIGLFFLVLIYGVYGPGYDAADFIYRGF